jgi:hypothetical protein
MNPGQGMLNSIPLESFRDITVIDRSLSAVFGVENAFLFAISCLPPTEGCKPR